MSDGVAVAWISMAGVALPSLLSLVVGAWGRRAQTRATEADEARQAETRRANAAERQRASDLDRLRQLLDEHREEIDRRGRQVDRLSAENVRLRDRLEGRP